MKTIATLSSIITFVCVTGIAQARDLGPDEALRLRDAGTVMSFEKLNAIALAKHPGTQVHQTELEQEYGKYVYQVELRDNKGGEWELDLDASTGAILKDRVDS
ncbi:MULTISPECIES: PepSY domain-containing protein [Pseudomonas]|uniref:PepSY domain-containing protein n=1 Tax=Pseudomonas TaxID=286 RepID=UPI001CFB0A82|nr:MULTISPECIES: PepSY domain-containing protein [Pseudomonas]